MNWTKKAQLQGAQKTSQSEATQQSRLATGGTTMVPLANIKPRSADTRPANPAHVLDMAESISALGLIEPIVIDRQDRLLAGLHRLTALKLLHASDRQAVWQQLLDAAEVKSSTGFDERLAALSLGIAASYNSCAPVRQLPFDAEEDPQQALAIEIAENEQRRDYTRAEVVGIKEQLESVGYSFQRGNQSDRKPGMPALQAVVGKSRRSLYRLLSPQESNVPFGTFEERAALSIERTTAKWAKSSSLDANDPAIKKAKRLATQLATLIRETNERSS